MRMELREQRRANSAATKLDCAVPRFTPQLATKRKTSARRLIRIHLKQNPPKLSSVSFTAYRFYIAMNLGADLISCHRHCGVAGDVVDAFNETLSADIDAETRATSQTVLIGLDDHAPFQALDH